MNTLVLGTTSVVREVYGPGMLLPPWSHYLSWLVTGILVALVALSVVRMVRARRRARAADRAFEAPVPTQPGPAVVCGTVEYARDRQEAVRVEILQEGREWRQKGGWRHKWCEVGRETIAMPFYLRCCDGGRVRVEPGAKVTLMGELDRIDHRAPAQRMVIAELHPGARVIVEGVLHEAFDPEAASTTGYRDHGMGRVLKPSGDPLVIASAGLADKHRGYARGWRRLLWTSAAILLFSQAMFVGYYTRIWSGTPRSGRIVDVTHNYRTEDTHVVIDVDGRTYRLLAKYRDYWPLKHAEHTYVREAGWATALGRKPTLPFAPWLLAAIATAFAILFSIGLLRRPWYRGHLTVSGPGRL